jgi:hypothetical protein
MSDGRERTANEVVSEARPMGGFPDVDTGVRFAILVEGVLTESGMYEPVGSEPARWRLRRTYRSRWDRIAGGEL